MPEFLEKKLEKEYPDNPHAVYGTMNKLGVIKGNKETKKGKLEEKKHEMAKKWRREEKTEKKHGKKEEEEEKE